ncbi:MAG TPA: hypothetical protein VNH11_32435 [Pirellulales bacterium]|nr:hypothetical protein [Pirellulales bacterium]
MRKMLGLIVWTVTTYSFLPALGADDETQPSKAEKRAARRLEIMRGAIDDFQVSSSEIEDESALKFSDHALLRYHDQSREAGEGLKGVVDATLWRLGVFANGTNPEMGLLLECSDKQWSFGTFRLTSAALFAQFDGKSIDVAAKPKGYPVDAPYTATRHGIFLPEDAAE